MTNTNRNALKNTSVLQIQIIQNHGVLCAYFFYFFLRGGGKQSQQSQSRPRELGQDKKDHTPVTPFTLFVFKNTISSTNKGLLMFINEI